MTLRKMWPAILLAAVLLWLALRGVDWRTIGHTVVAAKREYLAAALALGVVSSVLRALRWRILLNAEGNVSPLTVYWAMMAGYLGNLVLPARAGELLRTFLIAGRSTLTKTYVLTTAIGERLSDGIALVLFSALSLLAVESKPEWMGQSARVLALLAVAGALAIAFLPRFEGFLLRRLRLPAFARHIVEQIVLGVRAFHSAGRFGGFAAFTLVIWSCDTVGAMVVGHALGLPITFPMALLFISALGLGSGLPSTPGYVGIYQFVAVTVLGPFGVSREAAIAFVLILQALNSVLFLSLGSLGLLRLGASLTSFRKTVAE